jgi:uncharacterized membrane protein YidH (DUF202 family)
MKKVIYGLMSFAPVLAFAQDLGQVDTLVTNIKGVLNNILPVLLALAIIYFFWGLVKFIKSAGDAKARDEGKGVMIWGIIAIFVMVSVFGIVNWLGDTTGLDAGTVPDLPQI